MLIERKNLLAKYYIIAVIILLIFLHYLGIIRSTEDFFFEIVATAQNKTYTFLTKLKYSFVNFAGGVGTNDGGNYVRFFGLAPSPNSNIYIISGYAAVSGIYFSATYYV